MGVAREFFNKRIFINSVVFSVPVSLLLLWRITHLKEIPFFSAVAGQVYLFLLATDAVLYLFIFFILYLLSKRTQKD